MATPDDAIFRRDGAHIVPSLLAQGPWHPEAQHGGPVCALLARTIQGCETPVPMRVARITFDLMRQVPLRPLGAITRVLRSGKRVQLVEASLLDGELEVASARALMIRTDPSFAAQGGLPQRERPSLSPPRGEERVFRDVDLELLPGFMRALDFQRGSEPTPSENGTAWARLRCPVVAGEETTPLVRLAAICDFTSGIGNPLDHSRWMAINPDVSLHVLREPEGEWIGVNAGTWLANDGLGQSFAELHDERGLVARGQTSLLIDRR
jgi:hypothetical protein